MSFQKTIENKIQSTEFITKITGELPLVIKPLHGGHFSIVYGAELPDGSVRVLKFSKNKTELYNEQLFLKTWAQAGIRTPDIIELTPLPDGLEGAVLQMEFVVGQNLLPLMEKGAVDSKKILFDLGSILATMHTVTAKGCGDVVVEADGSIRGTEQSFAETLVLPNWLDTIEKNQQNGDLTNAELPLLDKAAALLDNQHSGLRNCLVHCDFRAGNILYDSSHAQPYTVIDPKPAISHPYFCLAYSLLLVEMNAKTDATHMRQGYESITALNNDVLRAAFFLRALDLLPWWGQGQWGQPDTPRAKALQIIFEREKTWLKNYG